MTGTDPVPPRCYVASPLGFNEAGRFYYEERYLPALAAIVEPVDPWAQVAAQTLDRAVSEGRLRQLWLQVGQQNLKLIRSSELLVAWLDGQEIDSGTAVELGYAAGIGLRCFGLRSDLRQAGEEEMATNLQVEATIVATGGLIVDSLENLVGAIRASLGRNEPN